MYPTIILTIVADIATNLSYPNNRMIDITNGTNINNGNVIPVNADIIANINIVNNTNFFPIGFIFITVLSRSFLYPGALFKTP